MSPAAVTARLEMLDELWQLGVELMKANPKNREASVLTECTLPENRDTPDEQGGPKRLAELPQK